MKRIIAIALFALMATTCFASCGKEFTCGMCGKTSTGKEHKEEYFGTEISMCDDCYKSLQELADALGDFAN